MSPTTPQETPEDQTTRDGHLRFRCPLDRPVLNKVISSFQVLRQGDDGEARSCDRRALADLTMPPKPPSRAHPHSEFSAAMRGKETSVIPRLLHIVELRNLNLSTSTSSPLNLHIFIL
ncbi:hypothetical protein PoB_004621700 [Plakobranchus ocellatus]|uniref:Uncharacterized protein n=1 Tax=Plakobranchus ocellatus TaxID=259542 RepID=A0AAV4BLB1_9GAST|nr:hypothetical protein PoB_004621700 [Plakobranchus ocellatus]